MSIFPIRFLLFFLLFFSALSTSKPIELSKVPNELFINEHLYTLQNSDGDLSFSDVYKQYGQKKFTKNTENKISFGFSEKALWASVRINNTSKNSITKTFYIDSAWLDHADYYFVYNDKLTDKFLTGDTLPFDTRENKTRMLSQTYTFETGITQVFMRFESKDPMIIPLYLSTEDILQKNATFSSYFYGFIYGAFFILLLFNLILFISLKDISYFLYAMYLLSFLSLNIVYSGHGFQYFWPNNIVLQQWLMPLLAFSYFLFGIAFCFEFLKLKEIAPKLYRMKNALYGALVLLAILLTVNGDRMLTLKVTLSISSLLAVIFISLAYLSYKNNGKMVKFFIPAVLMGSGGAAISSAATWGLIPYNNFVFHSVELGMLIEMSIFALALGFNLKEVNKARIIAEVNAQIDYLTNLYNRRAFIAAVTPLWHLGRRENKSFSMMLIDIDWFKRINDNYGHAAGDTALKAIASTLSSEIRKSDVIARWGGEEFIVFLPNTNKQAALTLANNICQRIECLAISHDEHPISITVSVGVADINDHVESLEDLIKLADIAMYKAKNSGRNRVCTIEEQPGGSETLSPSM